MLQGNARFTVSFTPTEACEHIVNVSFNKVSLLIDQVSFISLLLIVHIRLLLL